MSYIIESNGNPPEEDRAQIRSYFETSPTMPLSDEFGYASIQIRHAGKLYTVGIARQVCELDAVKALDHEAFGNHRRITTERLANIRDDGFVLTLNNDQGELIAESQILLSPTPDYPVLCQDEARCMGTAVKPGEEGRGYAQVMIKAQEVVAREAGKTKMTLSVRPENAESIRIREYAGFRIDGYELDGDGIGCFIMTKDFTAKPLPSDTEKQIQRFKEGTIPVIASFDELLVHEVLRACQEKEAEENEMTLPTPEVAVPIAVGDMPDAAARELSAALIRKGYIGTGILRPDEYGAIDRKSLLIFQLPPFKQPERSLPVELPKLPFHVESDYGPLREVVLSISPNAVGSKYKNNNKTASVVEETMNQVEIKDEHEALVQALEREGIKVVRSHAFHSEVDRWGVFTRDPGVVIDDTMVVGSMYRENRRYEAEAMKALAQGENVIEIKGPDTYLEGGDVILLGDNLIAVGIGDRTNKAGYDALVKAFEGKGKEFIGVPHQALHLDVIFTVVGHKKVLADLEVLSEEFVDDLKARGFTVIPSEHTEQHPLGANVLAIDNNKVIAVAENKVTNQSLRDAGVEVIEVSMPNIIKGGGGPRCLTCPTHRV